MVKPFSIFICVLSLLVFWLPASAQAAPFLPDFSSATFLPGAPVNHLYFPIEKGTTRSYEGQKEEDGEIITEEFHLTGLGLGPTILGVQTTILRDRAFEDGLLVEDTFDYYAQDTNGNVWYFGEDVTNFIYDEEDNLIGTTDESAWLAGVNDALPGFIMPADLTDGFHYYQEFAPNDDAVDQATTYSNGNSVSIGFGTFSDVLQVLETNPLELDAREFKYYAPGLGLILVEEGLNLDLEDPELSVELVSTVPEPSSILLLGSGLMGLATWRYTRHSTHRVKG